MSARPLPDWLTSDLAPDEARIVTTALTAVITAISAKADLDQESVAQCFKVALRSLSEDAPQMSLERSLRRATDAVGRRLDQAGFKPVVVPGGTP